MGDFIAKSVASGAITEFASTPVELAQALPAGQYDLKPIGGPTIRVSVLDVQNTAIPTVSGTASPGNTLTGTNGTWSGVLDATTPYQYRWLDITTTETVINGATSATFAIPASGYEGKNLAYEVRAQNARGQWTGWVRSATISISNLTFNVSDAEWTWAEDADDAETRQGYATLTLLNDLPVGKRPRFYRGPNAAGNSAQTGWMTGSGRNWTFDPVNAVDPGARDYGAIYMQTDDGAGNPIGPVTQISTVKYFDASNVPGKPGLPAVTAGTLQTGDVVIDPNNTPPAANGRPIIEYGYSVDGAAIIALSGGTATTARTVSILNTVAVQVRVHSRNVNGWSVGSDPVSVTPPTITAGTNTKAPELSANLYGGGVWAADFGEWSGSVTLTGALEQSDNGTTGWTTYDADAKREGGTWPDSSLAGKYMRLKVTPSSGTPAYSTVIGPLKAGFNRTVFHWQPRQTFYQDATSPANFTLENGIWLTALIYFDGTLWQGMPMGFGQSSANNPTNNAINTFLNGGNMRSAGGSVISFTFTASLGNPASAGWYRVTHWYYRVGSTIHHRTFRNEENPTIGTATNSTLNFGSLALRFSLFGRASLSNVDDLVAAATCDYAIGIGNPTDMHAWLSTYTNGAYRAVADYNFAGDALGCTLQNHWVAAALNPGSWNGAAQLVNVGPAAWITGAWSVVNAGGTNTTWIAKRPGYIDGSSTAAVVPEAYISPRFGTTEDTYSIQTGRMGAAIPTSATWATGRGYAIGDRVSVSGTVYRCRVAHTSGATFAGDSAYWTVFTWTINSLSHSVLGDLLPTLSSGFFTCATAGILTASVTCGSAITPTPANWVTNTAYSAPAAAGSSGSRVVEAATGNIYECVYSHMSGGAFAADLAKGYWRFQYGTLTLSGEILEAAAMPASPRLATRFGGNALVCAIEPYPATGTGTTFANAAALASAAGSLSAGATLTVNDFGDFSETLTLPPRDYGGAVIECKNVEGVKVSALILNGCLNLTIRGFAVNNHIYSGVYGTSTTYTTGNVIEHCRCANIFGHGVSVSTSTITIRNVLGWDTAVEPGRANADYTKVVRFKRARLERVGWGRSTSLNVIVVSNIAELIINRLLVWQGVTTDTSGIHADLMQTVPASGAENVFSGMIRNAYFFDRLEGAETKKYQGMFWTDNSMRDLLVKNVISNVDMTNGITLSGNRYNVRVEDNICATKIGVNKCLSGAAWVRNNVMNSAGTILGVSTAGPEDTTLSLSDLGLGLTTVFPDYAVYPDSWRAFRPASGYETRGAGAMVAELEAKRVALGL